MHRRIKPDITTNNVSSVSTFTSEQWAVEPQPSLLHRHRKVYPRIYLPTTQKTHSVTARSLASPTPPTTPDCPGASGRQPPQQRGKKRGGKRARRAGGESRRWAARSFAAFCLSLCVAGFETTRGVVAALIVLSCMRCVLQCRTRGWEDEEWDPYPDEHNLNIKLAGQER
jgi:hypothetical protein